MLSGSGSNRETWILGSKGLNPSQLWEGGPVGVGEGLGKTFSSEKGRDAATLDSASLSICSLIPSCRCYLWSAPDLDLGECGIRASHGLFQERERSLT